MIGGTLVRSTSSGMPRDKYLAPERFDDATLRIVEAIPEYPGEITNRELCKITGLNGPTVERKVSKAGNHFLIIEEEWNVYSMLAR
ncbi:MAG: hypothetical protein PHR69_00005 [Sphaerochaeta sp.]|nr:hypothetical protein [Sphaerochaeta sp.]